MRHPWRLGDACLWGKKQGEGKSIVCSSEGKHTEWVLCLEAFISLAGGNLKGDLRGSVSAEYSSVFQVSSFGVVVSTDWSAPGQGVISHRGWSWPHPPGFAALLGLELKCS